MYIPTRHKDPLAEFRTLLRERRTPLGDRLNISKLAEQLVVGRSHLSQVLNGHRTGEKTRLILFAHLTEREVKALGAGWWEQYQTWARFHGEHCSMSA